jgi:GNAT superfamily N-acetyltransferase
MTGTVADLGLVRALEERAFNAWPALQTLVMDGWLLRLAGGYTKRANSLNAWQPGCGIEPVLAAARPYFAAHAVPPIVRLSPLAPSDTDRTLAGLGYHRQDETIVMTRALGPGTFVRDPSITIDPVLQPDWFSAHAEASGLPSLHLTTHGEMLRRIVPSTAYGTTSGPDGGPAAAWGLAVLERGYVGLFDIVTAAKARRLGAGSRLCAGLLAWAAQRRAHTAYLQVVASNTPALDLYRQLGFLEAYRYHYRIGPSEIVE